MTVHSRLLPPFGGKRDRMDPNREERGFGFARTFEAESER